MHSRYIFGALLTSGIVAVDLYLKQVVASSFFAGERLEVIPGFFNITFIRNPGAGFGLLSGWTSPFRRPVLLAFSIVAVGCIFHLYFGPLGARKLSAVGLLLIAGGAIGNFYERVTAGAVVDYLDFYVYGYHWRAFNVADASITCGAALILLESLLRRPGAPQQS